MNRARAVRAAEPIAKPLPIAAVVLPTASSLSVISRTVSIQTGHLSDTAGIIGNGTVSVNSNSHTGGGQHTYSCQRDTIQTCELESDKDTYAIRRIGSAVDIIPTARPLMMVVAAPVSDCSAIFLTDL